MTTTKSTARALLTLASLVLAPVGARAQVLQTFATTGTSEGQDASAQALFTFSGNSLTLTLTNRLAPSAIRSSGQGISGFTFSLNTALGPLTTSTVSGQLADLSNTGVATFVTGSPTRFLNNNDGFNTAGTTFETSLLGNGSGQPNQFILPAVLNGGSFANANNSLTGRNPSTIGAVTFTFTFASPIPTSARVTSAEFGFGSDNTRLTGTQVGQPTVIPEPATVVLLGAGLAAVGAAARRRRGATA